MTKTMTYGYRVDANTWDREVTPETLDPRSVPFTVAAVRELCFIAIRHDGFTDHDLITTSQDGKILTLTQSEKV